MASTAARGLRSAHAFAHTAALACALVLVAATAHAQSPELSLRELASGQIKKGVRTIGFGGDGATWGNYSMVYRDAGGAILDAGATFYDTGNTFSFTAVGFASPSLWHGLTVYAIALAQSGTDIHVQLRSPGLGSSAVGVRGNAANQAVFLKAAIPLAAGLAVGVLLSYEVSQYSASSDATGAPVRFSTAWRPSGGSARRGSRRRAGSWACAPSSTMTRSAASTAPAPPRASTAATSCARAACPIRLPASGVGLVGDSSVARPSPAATQRSLTGQARRGRPARQPPGRATRGRVSPTGIPLERDSGWRDR